MVCPLCVAAAISSAAPVVTATLLGGFAAAKLATSQRNKSTRKIRREDVLPNENKKNKENEN